MAVTAVASLDGLVIDYTIDPQGGGGASVPTSRLINTTAPITGGGPLSADLTLALTTSPVGQTPVGVTRLITTTAPLTIGGGASADLSADRTLAVATFVGTTPGVVPGGSAGNAGKFLSGAGTWVDGTVTGVSSVSGTAPVVVSPTTGAAVVSVPLYSAGSAGLVPAAGAGSTLFLSQTGWAAISAAGVFVTLQGVTPGNVETGNTHVSGVQIASGGFTNTPVIATAGLPSPASLLALTHGRGVSVDTYSNTGKFAGGLNLRRFRGTTALPVAVADTDWLGVVSVEGQSPSGPMSQHEIFGALADGPASADVSPATFITGGTSTGSAESHLWLTKVGTWLGRNQTAKPTMSSEINLMGGIAVKRVTKTANYTVLPSDVVILIDASANDVAITLPAVADGRWLKFMRIERGSFRVNLVGNVQGIVNPEISGYQALTIFSDGSNWFVYDNWEKRFQDTMATSSTAINTTVAKSYFDRSTTKLQMPELAGRAGRPIARYQAYGLYSTKASAAGTLRFFADVYEGISGHQDFGLTRATTVSDGIASEPWQADIDFIINPVTNLQMLRGVVNLSDSVAGADKTLVMTRALPLFNSSLAHSIGLAVQWSVSDVGNSILVNYQGLSVDPQSQF
jgi:hypothetical protein